MEKIKIIFLDIDGVLRRVKDTGFNKKSIDNLNDLIRKTDAKIVISSTWRQRGIEDVKKFLFENNVKGEIIDITPIFVISKVCGEGFQSSIRHTSIKSPRGLEIREWLRDYTTMDRYVESYVIIDDSGDMMLSQVDNYVKVEQTVGFDSKCLKKAINILNVINIPTF